MPFTYLLNDNQKFVFDETGFVQPTSFSLLFKYNPITKEIEGLLSNYMITNNVSASSKFPLKTIFMNLISNFVSDIIKQKKVSLK